MVDVIKLLPTELDIDSLYSVRVRTINAFGAAAGWSESLVVDTNVGFRRLVYADTGFIYYFENGKILASLYESDQIRYNLLKNPSFENTLTGWTRYGTTAMVSINNSTTKLFGASAGFAQVLVLTPSQQVGLQTDSTQNAPALPNETWTGSAYVYPSNDGMYFTVNLLFYNASMALLSQSFGRNITGDNAVWLRVSTTAKTPANTAFVGMGIVMAKSTGVNRTIRVDGCLLEKTSTVGAYFDGSTSSGATTWTGAAHNSTSRLIGATSLVTVNKDVHIGGSYNGVLRVFKQDATNPSFVMNTDEMTFGSYDGATFFVTDVPGNTMFEVQGPTGTVISRGSVRVPSAGLQIVGGSAFMQFYSGATAGTLDTPGTRSGYVGFYPDDEYVIVNEMANGDIKLTVNGTGEINLTGIVTLSKAPTLSNHAATKAYVDSNVFIPEIYTAASQAAMLALPATRGDYCLRTDNDKTYILKVNPASVLANWVVLPSDAIAEVTAHEAKADPHPGYLTESAAASTYVPDTRTITTTSPLRIDGLASADLNANVTLSALAFTNTAAGIVPSPAGATTFYLHSGGTWQNPHSQVGIDTFFRTGQYVSGGSGAAPAAQLNLSYGGVINNYRHGIFTTHNAAAITQNSIVFRLWQPADTVAGAPSNTVLTLDGALITATKPIVLPADPVNPMEAVTKQFIDNLPATTLDARYVNVTGDSMTGNLQMNLNLLQMTYGDISTDATGMRLNTNASSRTIRLLINDAVRLTATDTGINIPITTTISAGSLDFGSRTAQLINLFSTAYALGIQSNNMYFRTATSPGAFRFYSGGVHSSTAADPGAGGVELVNITNTSIQYKGRALSSELYVQSRLENLVTNGSGLLQDNTNFSTFVYYPNESYAGPGSFTYDGADSAKEIDELIPIDPSKKYKFSYAIKLLTKSVGSETPNHYGYVVGYDADRLLISPHHVYKYPGAAFTTLAVALNPGNTTITLASATGWYNSTVAGNKWIAFYPYNNAQGYTYPNYTYTRNVSADGDMWASGGISGNVITLRVPWAGPAYGAGTAVSNNQSAGTYDYIAGSNVDTPIPWTIYEGTIGKWDGDPIYDPVTTPSERSCAGGFRYGTAFVKTGWLLSYDTPVGTARTAIDAVDFHELEQTAERMYFKAPQGTPPFVVTSTTVVPNLNADLLDGVSSTGFILTAGGGTITSGNLNITASQLTFGTRSGAHILLSGSDHVLGVQGPSGGGQDTVYSRSPNAFYWYRGGVHDPVRGTAGAGGIALLAMTDLLFTYKGYKIWTAESNGHTIDSTGINADMLDSKHAVAFANREELEALLGDLLFVGVYDASKYLPVQDRHLPFNATVPNTVTGWTYDPPADASADFRVDCVIPSYGTAQRPLTGTPFVFEFSNMQVISSFRATDLSYYSLTSNYPSEVQTVTPSTAISEPPGLIEGGTFTITLLGVTTGDIQWDATDVNIKTALNTAIPGNTITVAGGPVNVAPFTLTFPNSYGIVAEVVINSSLTSTDPLQPPRLIPAITTVQSWLAGVRIQLRATWDKTTDTFTHYWRVAAEDLLNDTIPWIWLGDTVHAGKLLYDTAGAMVIGGQASPATYFTGNIYRVTASTNGTPTFDFKGSDVPPGVGPPGGVTTFLPTLGPTLTMVGTGMIRSQLMPDPDWDFGSTVYRHGMYWVCMSSGTLDFIDSDASGRYDYNIDDEVPVANGDWIIALIPGYVVSNKALTSNVATLTFNLQPDILLPPLVNTLDIGDIIDVTDVDDVFNGTYTITAKTATTISYAKVNANIASVATTTGSVAGQNLDQVIFQYIPFSTETYVKSQILEHTAAPDPHSQYLREAEADSIYAPIQHSHASEIRQEIIEHIDTDAWPVNEWEWDAVTGNVTLTVGLKSGISHNIIPLGAFELVNIHPDLNRRWPVLDVETATDKIRFYYETEPPLQAPADYAGPVTLSPPGEIHNDPHAQYLGEGEADLLYAAIDHDHDLRYELLGAVAFHEGKSDPHPQYLTESDGDELFLTEDEGNILYSFKDHTHPPVFEIHATDGASSAEIWVGDAEPTVEMGLSIGDLWVETAPILLQAPSIQQLTATNTATGIAVSISWQAWPAAELLNAISLERSTNGTTWTTTLTTDESQTSFYDSTVVANTKYYYRINASNPTGAGGYSAIVNVTTKPSNPTAVSATSSAYNAARVTWSAPAGGAGYTYEVFVNNVSKGIKTSPYDATGVTENTTYTFGVKGTSTLTSLVTGTVTDAVTTGNNPPPAPTGLVTTDKTHTSITIDWAAVSVSDLRDYQVLLNGVAKAYPTATAYTFTGLNASTSYTVGVKTRDDSLALSAINDIVVVTDPTPDTTPPTAPTIQSFKPEGAYGNMVVRYTLGTGTTAYRIDSSTNNSTWTIELNWTADTAGVGTARTLGTYAAGTTVYCRIYARDAALNTTYTNCPAYTLIASPTSITASATNHWRSTGGGTYNAMGTYRPVQGYYSNASYNAVGMWYYGTKPETTLEYGGRRTITSGSFHIGREDGGAGVGLDITLYVHSHTAATATSNLPGLLAGGVTINADLAWNGPAKELTLPAGWAGYLVSGAYRGLAIYRSGGDHYMTISNLTEDSLSGRLLIYHYG